MVVRPGPSYQGTGVPSQEMNSPDGPVVGQRRQPDRARRGLGRVAVAGGGGDVEIGAAQARCQRVDLDAVPRPGRRRSRRAVRSAPPWTNGRRTVGPHRREPWPVRYQGLDFPDGPGYYGRPTATGSRSGAFAVRLMAGWSREAGCWFSPRMRQLRLRAMAPAMTTVSASPARAAAPERVLSCEN
jgi:hypothetical protein